MSKKTEIELLNLFIFNSTYGPREGEENKKIMYYYPTSATEDTKIRNIGLCEAVIKFTQTFTETPSESLHTQHTRQLFYQPEPDFWMVMTLGVPCFEKPTSDGHGTTIEYREDEIQDHVYQAVLQQAYQTFRLFNGTIRYILTKTDVDGLKQRLEHFFNKYLSTLRVSHCDVMDIFNGIQFLPLDKNTYLRVQCFINQLEAAIPQITSTVFLYSDQLVWSGLEQEDMRVLYSYLVANLFPACNEQDFQSAGPQTSAIDDSTASHFGRFLLGPPNINDERNIGQIPRLHLNNWEEAEECHLVVYRALGATICLLVRGDFPMAFEFLRTVDKQLGVPMGTLATDIANHYVKKAALPGETQFKYMYFNRMNLAQKTSVHSGSGVRSANIPTDIMKLIADINHDLNTVTSVEDGETIVKASNECWIIGKKSDQREVYIVVNQKNANLIEINEEVRRLCASHFNNIFFLE